MALSIKDKPATLDEGSSMNLLFKKALSDNFSKHSQQYQLTLRAFTEDVIDSLQFDQFNLARLLQLIEQPPEITF